MLIASANFLSCGPS